jgi:hypothetical protein
MPDLVLGADVPYLRVILQDGATQKFAITVDVDPDDLTGVDGRLDFGELKYIAELDDSTYTWTLTASDIAKVTNRSSAVLSLENEQGKTILGRGIVEVRS